MGFLWIYPIASILVGLGLVGRFGTMNVFKLAAYGLAVIGLGGMVVFVLAQHTSGLDVNALLVANNTLQMIGSLCLFAIGVGLYQSRPELVPEEESSA